ncbi:hypothetical protein [Kitasatospora cinereorecta]|uniref:Uncharacterized protein n=1 Tax=Kitasatospora cinereorecta TaxID=285560 RepID=A0ABW0VI89_9ACTN
MDAVTVEIEGVSALATFSRLPDALGAVWASMRALPLGALQYDAYQYFFTRPDAVERVSEFIERDGELNLSFKMEGRSHALRVRPVETSAR